MEINGFSVSSSADAWGTSGSLTSSAASHLHQHVLQSPPGSQDSWREWGALPCSVLCVPGTTASAPGYMSSLHPAPGCAPSNAILGLGRMEKLWGSTGLPVSHCLPQHWDWVTSQSHSFEGGNMGKVLWDWENLVQRIWRFCAGAVCFLKHQHLITLHNSQLSYSSSEFRIST